jgi:hypothetical protein
MKYASYWNVGWQGDIDCDSFYCKLKTISKAELVELEALFTSDMY